MGWEAQNTQLLVSRARLAIYVTWVLIAFTLAMLLIEASEVAGIVDPLTMSEVLSYAYIFVGFGHSLVFVISMVLVGMWIYRAHANLHESGRGALTVSPGWAVGWFFIPIANLFKPFQAMRELWNASMGDADSYSAPAPQSVGLWWGSWLVANMVGNFSTQMSLRGGDETFWLSALLGAISSVALVVCARCLLHLIRDITQAQTSGAMAAEVFA